MPFYVKVGKVPPKRHTTFYKEDGKSLYREELFSTKGFSGIYSNKYHLYMPTEVEKIDEVKIDSSAISTLFGGIAICCPPLLNLFWSSKNPIG